MDTITDVIIHIRYTSREGGELLRKGAMKNLKTLIDDSAATGTTRLFSVRHEFPNEWEKFRSVQIDNNNPFAELSLPLREEHYPFWSKGSLNVVREVKVFARSDKNTITLRPAANDNTKEDVLSEDKSVGGLKAGKLDKIPLPNPVGAASLFIDDNNMSDLWITVAWGK